LIRRAITSGKDQCSIRPIKIVIIPLEGGTPYFTKVRMGHFIRKRIKTSKTLSALYRVEEHGRFGKKRNFRS